MTTPVPRRVQDLLAFAADFEDEFNTPAKPNKRKEAEATKTNDPNKENYGQPGNVAHTNANYNYGKRSANLDLSDSESDEENKTDHNLNCAILNDSFILSPNQDATNSTPSIPTTAAALKKNNDTSLSFLGRFGNMGINCSSSNSISKESPCPQTEQISKKPLPPPPSLHTIIERRQSVEIETPMRIAVPPSVATSHAKHDVDFVTPQVRTATGMCRGTRFVGSTAAQMQNKRCANNAANEFRSQKVLFQTPMTVSRGTPFPSDSLTFSLCDTISESPDTPATKPQQQQQFEPPTGKSKKSLENAFQATEKQVEKPSTALPMINNQTPNANVILIKNQSYTTIKKLGCGGSSSVYLARRQDTGEEFALKVVDLRADPLVVEGYLNETKLLEKLQGNVSVVALYDYELLRKESTLYMVMEKGDSDLNKILQSYTTNLPLYSLMNILYQMLQAVEYIHQNGVIHSDLKPANFLMVNGRLKLIDFGIASNIAVDSTSIIKFSPAGTFNYISPEALTDISTGASPMRNNQPKIKISTKSDVWSLGCILYLLLYQKTPFSHIRNINAKMNAIANPTTSIEYPALPVYYPIMLVHMAKNCLQLDPKKRPSCSELLRYPFHMVIPLPTARKC